MKITYYCLQCHETIRGKSKKEKSSAILLLRGITELVFVVTWYNNAIISTLRVITMYGIKIF